MIERAGVYVHSLRSQEEETQRQIVSITVREARTAAMTVPLFVMLLCCHPAVMENTYTLIA